MSVLSNTTPGLSRSLRIKRQIGFTLIELLIVVAILAILSGFAMLNMNFDNRGKQLQEQAEKIAALIELASDEAIYLQKELGIRFGPEDFVFYQLVKVNKTINKQETETKPKKEKPKWQAITSDKRLRRRSLMDGTELLLEISGVEVVIDEPGEEDVSANKVKPQILILSNGELVPEFKITLLDTVNDKNFVIASGVKVPLVVERPE